MHKQLHAIEVLRPTGRKAYAGMAIGKKVSSQSQHVPYGGAPLKPAQNIVGKYKFGMQQGSFLPGVQRLFSA